LIKVELLSRGFIIGISLAFIIGPITVLCIQRTLTYGFKLGFLTGIGSSLATSIYGVIAGISLAEIASFLITYQGIAAVVGGIILAWFGIMTFKSPSLNVSDRNIRITRNSTAFHSFVSAFLISLMNPTTVLLLISFYTNINPDEMSTGNDFIIFLAVGVFLGSVVWWLALSAIIEKARGYLSSKVIRGINMCSGFILLSLAGYAFLKTYKYYIN
jgi:threonine/homoserine/homoserine lactone efflux protein